MDQITGLRQANDYFEQVMARVPDFAPVYAQHSDLFIHMLNNAAFARLILVLQRKTWQTPIRLQSQTTKLQGDMHAQKRCATWRNSTSRLSAVIGAA